MIFCSLRSSQTLRSVALILLCLVAFVPPVNAAQPDHWVGTWGASPLIAVNTDGKIVAPDTTLREIVHVSLGGPLVRVVFSNELGLDPLTIGAARIAVSAGKSEIQLPSANIRPLEEVPPLPSLRVLSS